jgi:transcription elongation factor Elf1
VSLTDSEYFAKRDADDAYMYDQPRFACPYCGKQHMSENGMGTDVACCGEVGHSEQVSE